MGVREFFRRLEHNAESLAARPVVKNKVNAVVDLSVRARRTMI